MQITINQQEIEEAIRDHILTQISLRDNMRVDIDMAATRGPGGFTATINIVRNDAPGEPVETLDEATVDVEESQEEEEAPAKSSPLGIKDKISDAKTDKADDTEKEEAPAKPKRKSPVKKAEPKVENTEEPVEEQASEEPATEATDEATDESSEEAPATTERKGPSIFANLKKPTNEKKA